MQKIKSLKEIIGEFDCFIFDQFGVLHNGTKAYSGVLETLFALKKNKKQIFLISNSGKRTAHNLERMEKGQEIPARLFDFAVTSGELFRQFFKTDLQKTLSGSSVFLITRGEDRSVIEGLDLTLSEIETADFILLAGLDSPQISFKTYKTALVPGKKLPLVCINPDKKMIVGDKLYPASGALANFYESRGGQVTWIGKPFPLIFRHVLGTVKKGTRPERILMIGDSLEHDIAGAAGVGIRSLLITDGIHKDKIPQDTDSKEAEKFFRKYPALPDFITSKLNFI